MSWPVSPGDAWIQTVSIIQCVYCFMCIPVCYIPDKCKYAHTAYSLHGACLHGASPYGAERSPFPRSEKILSFEKGGFYVLYKKWGNCLFKERAVNFWNDLYWVEVIVFGTGQSVFGFVRNLRFEITRNFLEERLERGTLWVIDKQSRKMLGLKFGIYICWITNRETNRPSVCPDMLPMSLA